MKCSAPSTKCLIIAIIKELVFRLEKKLVDKNGIREEKNIGLSNCYNGVLWGQVVKIAALVYNIFHLESSSRASLAFTQ